MNKLLLILVTLLNYACSYSEHRAPSSYQDLDYNRPILKDKVSIDKIENIFNSIAKIPFYSYGDTENYPYKSLNFPYCGASAAVFSDQIKSKYMVRPKQVLIHFTDVYSNYCKYPTAYANFHTFSAIEGVDGHIYALDPAHVERPMPIEKYLEEYISNDCLRVTIPDMEKYASRIGSTAFYNMTLRHSNAKSLEEANQLIQEKIDSHRKLVLRGKVSEFPSSGYNNFALDLNTKKLQDKHFLYITVLEDAFKDGRRVLVDFNDDSQMSFIDAAYSWVALGKDLENFTNSAYAQKPYVSKDSFSGPH